MATHRIFNQRYGEKGSSVGIIVSSNEDKGDFVLTIMVKGRRWHRERNETSGECYRRALFLMDIALMEAVRKKRG